MEGKDGRKEWRRDLGGEVEWMERSPQHFFSMLLKTSFVLGVSLPQTVPKKKKVQVQICAKNGHNVIAVFVAHPQKCCHFCIDTSSRLLADLTL